ncbi:hypothetical protein HMI55_002350 [Coelomomyces lativittatus]|nr:hypothetical protein HMI55_002350 [Coelomomyces lativittatus]
MRARLAQEKCAGRPLPPDICTKGQASVRQFFAPRFTNWGHRLLQQVVTGLSFSQGYVGLGRSRIRRRSAGPLYPPTIVRHHGAYHPSSPHRSTHIVWPGSHRVRRGCETRHVIPPGSRRWGQLATDDPAHVTRRSWPPVGKGTRIRSVREFGCFCETAGWGSLGGLQGLRGRA